MSAPVASPGPRAYGAWLLALALAGAALVHWPALHSDFRHDDWLTFYQAANLRPLDFILLPHGGHLMMTRNAIHLAFFELFDLDPFPYFAASVATHLVNVALLFVLARRLAKSNAIAAFVAALWGMAPVQQASVNWVALYGNMTVATFTLWPLVELAQLAAEKRRPGGWAIARWCVLLAAAATSFGPGFAAALAAPAVAWLLLPPESGRNRVAIALGGLTLALVAVYLAIRPGGTFVYGPFWFSISGALDTLRAFAGLWSYGIACLVGGSWLTVGQDGVPFGPLHGHADAYVIHASWALAAIVGGAVAWAWRRFGALQRGQMAGLLLLIAAIQGLVAVGRAPVATYLIGLDALIVTARYQYVTTAVWAACLALTLSELARAMPAWRAPDWLAPAALAGWVAAVSLPDAAVAREVDWNTTAPSRAMLEAERSWIEEQIAAADPGEEVLIPNRQFEGMKLLQQLLSGQDFPGSAAVFLFLQHNAPEKNAHVKFIESDPAVVADLRARPHTKIGELLVTPEEAAKRLVER